MTEGQSGPPLPKVSIIHSHHMLKDYPQAAAAALAKHGFAARLHLDGDPEALKADLILFVGTLSALRKSVRMIERAAPRPKVAAWISEPLPPVELSTWARKLGVALSPSALGVTWAKGLTRPLTWPFYLVIRRFGQSRWGRDELDAMSLRFVLENLGWINRGVRRGWIDHIGASTEQKRQYLSSIGLAADFLPVGQQEAFGRLLGGPRDIDVLFIGSLSSKVRRRKLEQMVRAMEALGLKVHSTVGPIYGEARTELVNRAKVVLHLHRYPWDTPWMRWNLASRNGAAVASEPLSVPAPLVPSRDYLSAAIENLPSDVAALVADEERRRDMVRNCADVLETKMSLDQSISRLAHIFKRLLEA